MFDSTVNPDHTIKTIEQLRQHYGNASDISTRKVCSTIDGHIKHFSSMSTLLSISLQLKNNQVHSYLVGGEPNFIQVLDDKNIRIDLAFSGGSFLATEKDWLSSLGLGLILIVPGYNETVRIKGNVSSYDVVADSTRLTITFEHGFFHCAKAFMRSHLWSPPEQKTLATINEKWKGVRDFICYKKQTESENITSFYFTPNDEQPLASYYPGQHVSVVMNTADNGEVIRTYTLSDTYNPNYYRITVKREQNPAVGSVWLHDDLAVGDTIGLRAPSGKFYLDQTSTRPIVLLSAGVGLTPMIAMLNHLVSQSDSRDVWFIHGASSSKEHAMGEHVRQLAKQYPQIKVHICYSQPSVNDEKNKRYDSHGRVSIETLQSILPWGSGSVDTSVDMSVDLDFYLCGPISFMEKMGKGLVDQGVPSKRIRWEAFSVNALSSLKDNLSGHLSGYLTAYLDDDINKLGGLTPAVELPSCEVEFKKSGIKAQWQNTGQSLLELAESHGLTPRYSCRTGDCHSCTYRLLKGEVHYDPAPEDEPDRNNILLCCSKPVGNTVIDL